MSNDLMKTTNLFHYTCVEHLPKILESNLLLTTESNIGSVNPRWKPFGEHVGPDVVWLTDDAEVTRGYGLKSNGANKYAIRFTVRCTATPWSMFASHYGINRSWYRALNRSGGNSAHRWFVCPRAIPIMEWVEVRNMVSGQVLLAADDLLAATAGRR